MRRRWWMGMVVVLVAAGAGGAVWMHKRGPQAAGSAQAAGKPGDAASAVPLEFRANEVVLPMRASLPHALLLQGPRGIGKALPFLVLPEAETSTGRFSSLDAQRLSYTVYASPTLRAGVLPQPFGPTRKRFSVSAVGLAPM